MKRRGLWLVALAGLLVLSLGTVVLASEAAATIRARFSCADVPGEAVEVTGKVTAHEWNTLKLQSGEVTYTIKTGPFKLTRNLPDLTNETITVDGYSGPGTNWRSEQADTINLIRARTITVGDETYDLAEVAEGQSGPVGGRNAGLRGGHGKMIHKAAQGSTL